MTLSAPAKTTSGSYRLGLTAVTALAPMVWGTTYLTTTEMLPPDHPAFAAVIRAVPAVLLALLIARQLPRGIWWFRSLVISTLNLSIFFPLLFVSAERLPGGVADVRCDHRAGGTRLDPAHRLGTRRLGRCVGGRVRRLAAHGSRRRPGSAERARGTAAGHRCKRRDGYLWLGLVGGLLAYTLWFRGIGRLRVTAIAMLGLLSPIVAAALGAVVLGETVSSLQVAGFAVALTAIVGSQLPEPRTRLDDCASAKHINPQGVIA